MAEGLGEGMPFRIWFFIGSTLAWVDDDGRGDRSSGMSSIAELWPDIAFMATPGRPEHACIELVFPVSPTVLRLARDGANGMEWAYVDVTRNVQVPAPAGPDLSTRYQQVVTAGPGPVLITIDVLGDARLVDTRTGLRGPEVAWTVADPRFPVLLLPGEPARWIDTRFPPHTLMTMGSLDGQSLSGAFGLATSTVDAVTLTYGDLTRPATAAWTSTLDDSALNPFRRLIGEFVDGQHVLATLHVLTGLDPLSWHPDGSFGLAHMSADQIAAGGWTDAPELILDAGARVQAETFVSFLETLAPDAHDTPAELLAVLRIPPGDVPALVAQVDALAAGPFGREVTARFTGSSLLT